MSKISAAQVDISILANEAAMIAATVPTGVWATLARAAAQSVSLSKQRRTAEKKLCDVRYYAARGKTAEEN